MFENIDYINGEIIFNDLDLATINFLKDMDITEKDLLFVKFPNNISLDVDWHKGSFYVSIIKNDNWEYPIIKKNCKTINELENTIKECIKSIQTII